jgi:hypothetical protein
MEARSFGCKRKHWKEHAPEIYPLLDSILTLKQAHLVARTLQNKELLCLIDLAIIQISKSINGQVYFACKVDDSIGLN